MNINSLRTSANHHIKQDRDNTLAKAGNKKTAELEGGGKDEPVKMNLNPNQKLIIGAKALMASLNKQLSLGDSFSFGDYINESISLKDGQPVQLDKIEIKPFEFDFELVAKNVMDFVSGVILGAQAGGASDDKLNELLSQARSGVEQGFSMAREELKGFDIFTPEIEEGLDKSYNLINRSIDDLEQQLFNAEIAPDVGATNTNMRRFDLLEQEQGTISIKTKDGDSINIHFGNITSLSQQQQIDNGVMSHSLQFSESQSLSFQVEGNLDKQELKAISSLVKDVSKLADSFFSGNLDQAWQRAGKLGFDDQQIAQFSLDFKELKQVAVLEHYGKTSNLADSPIATIAPYLKDLNSLVNQADSVFSGDNLRQLMHSVARQQGDLMAGVLAGAEQNFVDFNQRLLEA